MLSRYLDSALYELQNLIRLTKEDIEDIKQAHHNPQFERSKTKSECVTKFEQYKALIDNEIAKLMQLYPQRDISSLLDDSQYKKLDQLKLSLVELKDVNKRYAKMVLAVSEFYNSLLEKMLPVEHNGYQKVASNKTSRLEVRV